MPPDEEKKPKEKPEVSEEQLKANLVTGAVNKLKSANTSLTMAQRMFPLADVTALIISCQTLLADVQVDLKKFSE